VRWADDGGRGERPAVKAAAKKKRGNTELEDWARAATKRAQRAESECAQFWDSTASVSAYPRHERFARRGTARREPERDRACEPVVLTAVQRNINSSIGPAWTSEDNGHNLLSEHQLLRHGISVVKVSGGALYLEDAAGVRYPISTSGTQFIVDVAHRTRASGSLQPRRFILDGGCFSYVVGSSDAGVLAAGGGSQCVSVGLDFTPGSREDLFGGDEWCVSLRDENEIWRATTTKITAMGDPRRDDASDSAGRVLPVGELGTMLETVRQEFALPLREAPDAIHRSTHGPPRESRAQLYARLGGNEAYHEHLECEAMGDEDLRHEWGATRRESDTAVGGVMTEEDTTESPSDAKIQVAQYCVDDGGALLRRTREGTRKSAKRTQESDDKFNARRATEMMARLGMSLTSYNEAVVSGDIKGVKPLAEGDELASLQKMLAGSKQASRIRNAKRLKQKVRIEQGPFSMVFVDWYEGAAGCAEDSESRHQYVLRFVCGSCGYQKSKPCLTKNAFVDAFRMYLAWVRAIAPIVEQHRGLPPGHIAVRVLASDRDSNFTTITGGTRMEKSTMKR
jgi:hypothetical protein